MKMTRFNLASRPLNTSSSVPLLSSAHRCLPPRRIGSKRDVELCHATFVVQRHAFSFPLITNNEDHSREQVLESAFHYRLWRSLLIINTATTMMIEQAIAAKPSTYPQSIIVRVGPISMFVLIEPAQ